MMEQTGLGSDVCVAENPEELTQQLKDGKVQVGAFHGFEFAWARQQHPQLKPLMIAVKRQSFCRALVVVRQDCKIADPTALRGKSLAVPLFARPHCRLFLSCRCVPKDTPPEKWFAKVCAPRTDQDALDDVAEGTVDAAIVDDVELEAYRATYPKTSARLRVLQQSEVFPATVIAYQPGTLNEETLKRLRAGMIDAKTTERGRKLLTLFRLTAFEDVPADFEQTVADIVKAYPAPTK
jgi:ABC-type phosphate/phosphonate transport system substrate-binding protein